MGEISLGLGPKSNQHLHRCKGRLPAPRRGILSAKEGVSGLLPRCDTERLGHKNAKSAKAETGSGVGQGAERLTLDRTSDQVPRSAMPSATIKLFLPTGDPQGLKIAELSNWNGKALAAPRSELKDLLAREEMEQPGIYCLTGTDDETNRPAAYIGEAETLGDRLRSHREKDFWVQANVFLSKDENLTKAHTRYLEGRVIDEALKAGRWQLVNGQSSGAKLPESDRAEMEVFFGKVAQLLPLLGCDLFGTARPTAATMPLVCTIKELKAYGYRTPGGFLVLKNSEAVREIRLSASKHAPWMTPLRRQFLASGNLVQREGRLVFAKDTEFSSPSRAAAVVRGGNANGQTEWTDASGRTLKEIETKL